LSNIDKIDLEYVGGTTYTLTMHKVGSGSISPGNGTYNEGESVTLTAAPDEGWEFVNWTGSINRTSKTVTITMDGDKDITANFQESSSGGEIIAISAAVASSSDDAEQHGDNSVDINSSDLELVNDGSRGDQIVGMRFNGVDIPQGAAITSAYIQFTVDETDAGSISLTIRGEDTDNALTFSETDNNISARSKTSASVSWSPADWGTVGEAGSAQRTPDIKSVIQEIVDRNGWDSGNSLAIIISGSGVRTAESYDGSASSAPKLFVDFSYSSSKETVGEEPAAVIPEEYSLANYPNPFNPSTNIAFTIPRSSMVKITIYDMLGREIAKVVDNYYEAGSYSYRWNAAGAGGNDLPSGMYIARIESGSYVKMIKMLLLK
jgi:hypothetical protein